jgi:hypothetical protein
VRLTRMNSSVKLGSPGSSRCERTRGSVQHAQDDLSNLAAGDHQQQEQGSGRDCRGRRKRRYSDADVGLRCAEHVDSANQRRGRQRGRRGDSLPKR